MNFPNRPRAIHQLKCWPEPFRALCEGRKRFEFRKDDRTPRFDVNDTLQLVEWSPEAQEYTGQVLVMRIDYLLRGPDFGIPEGFAVMSISIEGEAR
jgi:hypothetical protein